MNRLFILLILVLGLAGWWLWEQPYQLREMLDGYVNQGEYLSLEARYTPEYLMEAHKRELLPTPQYSFQNPVLMLHPYLLMDVKYAGVDKKTKEGLILWSLTDGEMVLDTENWEKTHGFGDAIMMNASRNDFKLLYALIKKNGFARRDDLLKELHIEPDELNLWLASAANKHLIIQSGNEVQLHIYDPRIATIPQTKIKQAFVTKTLNDSQKTSRTYSRSDIEKISYAAFGPGFTIRNVREVYLPVHSLSVLNPDGSVHTTLWNALNGQKILSSWSDK